LAKKIIVSIFVIIGCCGAISPFQSYHVSHLAGLVSGLDCVKVDQATKFPLENEKCDQIAVTSKTNNIVISVGSNFGVEYKISNLDTESCLTVMHRLNHPKMTRPDGIASTLYERSFHAGGCEGDLGEYRDVFSWYVEESWEAAKGKWVFEVLVDGKLVINEAIQAR